MKPQPEPKPKPRTGHPWRAIQHRKDFARWAAKHPKERLRVEARFKNAGSVALLLLLSVVSCSRHVNGPTQIESGTVVDVFHKLYSNYTYTAYTYHYNFIESKMEWGLESCVEEYPEIFRVTFQCQHGRFAIDGPRGADCYQRLTVGQSVAIHYQQVFDVHDQQTNFADLYFVDAIPHVFKPEK